jgi:predicted HicB family RNase H-like nuclease
MGGKTSAASINKYIAKAYDRINLTVPKGQKEAIQAHAAAQGESVNAFIGRAIVEAMERDKGAGV